MEREEEIRSSDILSHPSLSFSQFVEPQSPAVERSCRWFSFCLSKPGPTELYIRTEVANKMNALMCSSKKVHLFQRSLYQMLFYYHRPRFIFCEHLSLVQFAY